MKKEYKKPQVNLVVMEDIITTSQTSKTSFSKGNSIPSIGSTEFKKEWIYE